MSKAGMEIFLYSGCTSIAYIYAMTIFKISVSIRCAVEKKYGGLGFKGLLHFDKPMLVLMLVKQAFSLTQIPDILSSEVLKASTFPNVDF